MELYIETVRPLVHELKSKRNFRFFVSLGVIVGCLLVIQFEFQQMGLFKEVFWADSFFDILFTPRFLLLFFSMLLFSSSVKSCLNSVGLDWEWMDSIVLKTESCLMQSSSLMILFSFGLACTGLLFAFFADIEGGYNLFKALIKCDMYLIILCFSGSYIYRLNEFLKIWWISATWGIVGLYTFAYHVV